ncbi:MAG TPA: antitoxin [Amycolatopsis sp.]
MALMKRLAILAGAAGVVQSYARKNPEKVNHVVGKAATFVDEKTKGKYHSQLSGAVRKVSDVTKPRPGH